MGVLSLPISVSLLLLLPSFMFHCSTGEVRGVGNPSLVEPSFWIRDYVGVSICNYQQIFFYLLTRRNSWSSSSSFVLLLSQFVFRKSKPKGRLLSFDLFIITCPCNWISFTSRIRKPGETMHRSVLCYILLPTLRPHAVFQMGEKSSWPVLINLFIALAWLLKINRKLRTCKCVLDH